MEWPKLIIKPKLENHPCDFTRGEKIIKKAYSLWYYNQNKKQKKVKFESDKEIERL